MDFRLILAILGIPVANSQTCPPCPIVGGYTYTTSTTTTPSPTTTTPTTTTTAGPITTTAVAPGTPPLPPRQCTIPKSCYNGYFWNDECYVVPYAKCDPWTGYRCQSGYHCNKKGLCTCEATDDRILSFNVCYLKLGASGCQCDEDCFGKSECNGGVCSCPFGTEGITNGTKIRRCVLAHGVACGSSNNDIQCGYLSDCSIFTGRCACHELYAKSSNDSLYCICQNPDPTDSTKCICPLKMKWNPAVAKCVKV